MFTHAYSIEKHACIYTYMHIYTYMNRVHTNAQVHTYKHAYRHKLLLINMNIYT